MGEVAACPAARAAGRAARAGHASAAGGAACGRAPFAARRRAQGSLRPRRSGDVDPALRLGRQPQDPPALPGSRRRVPVRRRWRLLQTVNGPPNQHNALGTGTSSWPIMTPRAEPQALMTAFETPMLEQSGASVRSLRRLPHRRPPRALFRRSGYRHRRFGIAGH